MEATASTSTRTPGAAPTASSPGMIAGGGGSGGTSLAPLLPTVPSASSAEQAAQANTNSSGSSTTRVPASAPPVSTGLAGVQSPVTLVAPVPDAAPAQPTSALPLVPFPSSGLYSVYSSESAADAVATASASVAVVGTHVHTPTKAVTRVSAS